jgi:hypothetical protein
MQKQNFGFTPTWRQGLMAVHIHIPHRQIVATNMYQTHEARIHQAEEN